MKPWHARTLAAATWALPAVVTLLVCLVDLGRPALWQDELATWSATTRSLPGLVQLVMHVDGVLVGYYALMHGWVALVGVSPVALRLPSAVAMAATTAVVAVIGSRLFGRRAGLLASLLLAALPAVSTYGQEARAYALTMLLAATSTLLLLRLVERASWGRALAYGLGLGALGASQLTAVLLVGAHLVAVLASRRDPGPLTRRWLTAVATAAIGLAPLVYVGHRQRDQVGWIPRTSWHTVADLPTQLAGATWPAVLVLTLALVALGRRERGIALCLVTAVVPVLGLLAISAVTPLFLPRYLLPTLVGWALLAGAALARAPRPLALLALVAVAATGLPAQLVLRGPTKNDQPDYRAIAHVMVNHTRPGDAVVVPTAAGVRFRVGVLAYLPATAWPQDALVVQDAATARRLDARECRPATCLGSPQRLWVGCRGACTGPLGSLAPETARLLRARGYRLVREWVVQGGAVSLLRPPAAR